MLKNLNSNNDGVILITVLLIVLTMMVLVISIISMRVSSVSVVENEIAQIQAETFARGALAYIVANQYAGGTDSSYELIDNLGRDFKVCAIIDSTATGFGGTTNSLSIDVYY